MEQAAIQKKTTLTHKSKRLNSSNGIAGNTGKHNNNKRQTLLQNQNKKMPKEHTKLLKIVETKKNLH